MRKLMMAVCFALLAGGTLSAQERTGEQRERWNPEMVAKRMAGKLMLDDNVSAKFIPLYQEYMQKLAECRVKRNAESSKDGLSDEEIDESILANFSSQEKRLKVQKDYYGKFKEILTMRQVKQLYDRPFMGRQQPAGGQKRPGTPRR